MCTGCEQRHLQSLACAANGCEGTSGGAAIHDEIERLLGRGDSGAKQEQAECLFHACNHCTWSAFARCSQWIHAQCLCSHVKKVPAGNSARGNHLPSARRVTSNDGPLYASPNRNVT